jgi:transcriptional regulator with XRE-family HTH domain
MKTDLKPEFVRLRAIGLAYGKIAEQMGVSKTTLIAWEKELKSEIAEAQFFEFQTLMSEYKLCKVERLKYLSNLYRRLADALAEKDFSEVEPPKMLEMLLRVEAKLGTELSQVKMTIQEGIIPQPFIDGIEMSLWNES